MFANSYHPAANTSLYRFLVITLAILCRRYNGCTLGELYIGTRGLIIFFIVVLEVASRLYSLISHYHHG